jgi:hypothetical protein
LHLIVKKPVNFAECAAKLTNDRIRKAKENPWKLTPPALREQIKAMVRVLASPTMEPPLVQQPIVQRPRTTARHLARSTVTREAPSIALAIEKIHKGEPNGPCSPLEECETYINFLEAAVEDL